VSLLFGLLVSAIGLDNPAGFPRFTFGNAEQPDDTPNLPLDWRALQPLRLD
jgi:putative tricarboxylic transport membrane protein